EARTPGVSAGTMPLPQAKPVLPTTISKGSPTGRHAACAVRLSKSCAWPVTEFQSDVVTTTICVEEPRGELDAPLAKQLKMTTTNNTRTSLGDMLTVFAPPTTKLFGKPGL